MGDIYNSSNNFGMNIQGKNVEINVGWNDRSLISQFNIQITEVERLVNQLSVERGKIDNCLEYLKDIKSSIRNKDCDKYSDRKSKVERLLDNIAGMSEVITAAKKLWSLGEMIFKW